MIWGHWNHSSTTSATFETHNITIIYNMFSVFQQQSLNEKNNSTWQGFDANTDWKYSEQADRTTLWAWRWRPPAASVTSTRVSALIQKLSKDNILYYSSIIIGKSLKQIKDNIIFVLCNWVEKIFYQLQLSVVSESQNQSIGCRVLLLCENEIVVNKIKNKTLGNWHYLGTFIFYDFPQSLYTW